MADTRTVVYAALAGNILVAVTKAVAAFFTGSSAMLSEAVHSFVDTGNEVLLLYGQHRSQQKPDKAHPFGYGRELYFWSFIVALLIFAVGAGVSVFEGINHLRRSQPIDHPIVNYIVLGLSLVFEGASWFIAMRSIHDAKGNLSYWQAFRQSKDPPQFMVLLEDSAAIIGILIALLGTGLSQLTGNPRFDGAASILIAGVLAVVAVLLARESKELLIGERADPGMARDIIDIAGHIDGIHGVNGIITSQMSPDEIVAAMSVEFEPDLRVPDVERIVAELEAQVRQKHPDVLKLFVKPQKCADFREAYQQTTGHDPAADGIDGEKISEKQE